MMIPNQHGVQVQEKNEMTFVLHDLSSINRLTIRGGMRMFRNCVQS